MNSNTRTLSGVADVIITATAAALSDWVSAKLCERFGSHDIRVRTKLLWGEGPTPIAVRDAEEAACRWCGAASQ